MSILTVDNLKTYFHTRNGIVKAVDGISYSLNKGECLGIVGESGSGKSVSCYSILGLIPTPPGRIESGRAMFGGVDMLNCPSRILKEIRGKRISMIFQDPMTCLNPYLTVGDQLMEPLLVHGMNTKQEARQKAIQALDEVGILESVQRIKQYPHEFSGGMRQRVMIAMALISEPDILIADEPTTALDVTVQAQIIDLIKKLQQKKQMAVIFITHDLGVIAEIADQVLVMYAGKVMEQGSIEDIFYRPQHPYTRDLLDSMPSKHASGERLFTIPGLPPDVSKPINGCAFHSRCQNSTNDCSKNLMTLAAIQEQHKTACLRMQRGEIT